MSKADIAAGVKLCRASGWNQLERDWEIWLQLGSGNCRVATINEEVIGTVTTIRYQNCFSWIGMVLVDPERRRQGFGTRLLEEALGILHNEVTIKLDATPAGREIYLPLNFLDEYKMTRMCKASSNKTFNFSVARSVQKKDLPAIARFDFDIFGADRRLLLEWMRQGSPEYAFFIEEHDEIQGFCFGRKGHDFIHIGPVVARNLLIAKEILATVLSNCIGQPVILDATQFDHEWINYLHSIGFSEQRSFTRMYRGSNKFPGLSEKQFAILGPEFG
ncbi:MAG: GNAT family N-acetyltransferase [Chitinophagaceae bacterium]